MKFGIFLLFFIFISFSFSNYIELDELNQIIKKETNDLKNELREMNEKHKNNLLDLLKEINKKQTDELLDGLEQTNKQGKLDGTRETNDLLYELQKTNKYSKLDGTKQTNDLLDKLQKTNKLDGINELNELQKTNKIDGLGETNNIDHIERNNIINIVLVKCNGNIKILEKLKELLLSDIFKIASEPNKILINDKIDEIKSETNKCFGFVSQIKKINTYEEFAEIYSKLILLENQIKNKSLIVLNIINEPVVHRQMFGVIIILATFLIFFSMYVYDKYTNGRT